MNVAASELCSDSDDRVRIGHGARNELVLGQHGESVVRAIYIH